MALCLRQMKRKLEKKGKIIQMRGEGEEKKRRRSKRENRVGR